MARHFSTNVHHVLSCNGAQRVSTAASSDCQLEGIGITFLASTTLYKANISTITESSVTFPIHPAEHRVFYAHGLYSSLVIVTKVV